MSATLIKDYSVKSGDVFFFDTNVWMAIFGPLAGTRKAKQRGYSNLLRDIQSARASIFVSSLVLAEYVNACLQIAFADRISDSFNAVNVVRFFDMHDIDFNDAYYIELCNMQSNKDILVTDDKDILNSQSVCAQMLTAETC